MKKYLSQEWLDELVALSAKQPPRPGTDANVQYRTLDGPHGDIEYYWILKDGIIIDAKLGTLDDPDFTMTSAYADAAAIQRGDLEPNAAFMQGKTKATGNVAFLMSLMPITASDDWNDLQDGLREITEY